MGWALEQDIPLDRNSTRAIYQSALCGGQALVAEELALRADFETAALVELAGLIE